MTKKAIERRLSNRLLAAAKEARMIARDDADPNTYRVHLPANVDVREIRRKLRLTQEEFATRFRLATIRDWEQHRRLPDRARCRSAVVAENNFCAEG
jgi:putative transcriptional regulator